MNLFGRIKQRFFASSNALSRKQNASHGIAEASHPAGRTEVPAEKQAFNAVGMRELLSVCSSPAFLERLLSVYLKDSKGHLEQLSHACVEQDHGLWRRTLHDMKGAAHNMRLDRLADTVQSAHKVSVQDFNNQAPHLLRVIEEEHRQAVQALKDAAPELIAEN